MSNTEQKTTMQDGSTHVLTRELDAFEQILWATDRIEPRHFLLVTEIDNPPSGRDFWPTALAAVQQRHPPLRVRIVCDPGARPRFVATGEPIQFRLDHGTGEAAWMDAATRELHTRFDAEKGPLIRVRLVQGESTSHLLLAVHHAIGDGISAVYLTRDILAAVQGELRAPLPARMSREQLITPGSTASRYDAVSMKVGHIPSRQPVIATFSLSPDVVDELGLRCRYERTTLHSALTAAALLASEGPSRRSLSPINARHHLPSIEDDVGLYITSGITSITEGKTDCFWEAARTVRTQLDQARTLPPLLDNIKAMRSMLANIRSEEDMQALWGAIRCELGYQTVLSNLGMLPFSNSESGVRVRAAYLLLNVEPIPVVGIATVGGRLWVTMSTADGDKHMPWFRRFEQLLSRATSFLR
ncbi:condensation domain-containing protein [Paraburkholderia youngii]|uniref:condensation domain-containing protein n=1 Tax=Paraburkholderia youngii TaxID=2782701 RepID=UPI003D1CBD1B